MGFYEDAQEIKDKESVRQWKNQFDNIISDATKYIDDIVTNRYGDLGRFSTHINLLKSYFEALKIKYPAQATQIDGFITTVDSEIAAVQDRWNTEIYDKLQV